MKIDEFKELRFQIPPFSGSIHATYKLIRQRQTGGKLIFGISAQSTDVKTHILCIFTANKSSFLFTYYLVHELRKQLVSQLKYG